MSSNLEVTTWEDLAEKIAALTPEQRQKPIQCLYVTPNDSDVQECLPAIAMATIDELGISRCRSVYDNQYHGDDIVLLLDGNPFAEDGAIAYEMNTNPKPETSLNFLEDMKPVYSSHGPTNPSDQWAPSKNLSNDDDYHTEEKVPSSIKEHPLHRLLTAIKRSFVSHFC